MTEHSNDEANIVMEKPVADTKPAEDVKPEDAEKPLDEEAAKVAIALDVFHSRLLRKGYRPLVVKGILTVPKEIEACEKDFVAIVKLALSAPLDRQEFVEICSEFSDKWPHMTHWLHPGRLSVIFARQLNVTFVGIRSGQVGKQPKGNVRAKKFMCVVCDITLNSLVQYNMHKMGRKHIVSCDLARKAGTLPENVFTSVDGDSDAYYYLDKTDTASLASTAEQQPREKSESKKKKSKKAPKIYKCVPCNVQLSSGGCPEHEKSKEHLAAVAQARQEGVLPADLLVPVLIANKAQPEDDAGSSEKRTDDSTSDTANQGTPKDESEDISCATSYHSCEDIRSLPRLWSDAELSSLAEPTPKPHVTFTDTRTGTKRPRRLRAPGLDGDSDCLDSPTSSRRLKDAVSESEKLSTFRAETRTDGDSVSDAAVAAAPKAEAEDVSCSMSHHSYDTISRKTETELVCPLESMLHHDNQRSLPRGFSEVDPRTAALAWMSAHVSSALPDHAIKKGAELACSDELPRGMQMELGKMVLDSLHTGPSLVHEWIQKQDSQMIDEAEEWMDEQNARAWTRYAQTFAMSVHLSLQSAVPKESLASAAQNFFTHATQASVQLPQAAQSHVCAALSALKTPSSMEVSNTLKYFSNLPSGLHRQVCRRLPCRTVSTKVCPPPHPSFLHTGEVRS